MSGAEDVPLRCHPWTPAGPVRTVDVRVARTTREQLTLRFRTTGELTRVRIPELQASRLGQRLWEHTCFEVFIIAPGDGLGYHEFNLSPSGAWAAHAFTAYRAGGPLDDPRLAPVIAVHGVDELLELEATIPVDRLSPAATSTWWRLGLAAVIEAHDGTRSYWALQHAAGKPDFHHPDAFALRVEAPGPRC